MKKIIDTLQSLGLNEKEVKIYIASLSMGQTTASILGKKAGIARSTAQYTCNSLVEKRLMNITPEGNSFIYSPEPPEKLISIVNKEYTQIEKKMQNTHQIMGYLNSLINPSSKMPKVTFYEGLDGVMDMLVNKHSIIKDDTYEFSAHIPLIKKYPKEIEKYSNLHMKNKDGFDNFVLDCFESKELNNLDGEKYNNLKFKYYKEKDLNINTHIQIDGDRIAIISNHGQSPMGIDILHEGIAKDLKKIFKQLWNNLD